MKLFRKLLFTVVLAATFVNLAPSVQADTRAATPSAIAEVETTPAFQAVHSAQPSGVLLAQATVSSSDTALSDSQPAFPPATANPAATDATVAVATGVVDSVLGTILGKYGWGPALLTWIGILRLLFKP